jgi:hypothetical protein
MERSERSEARSGGRETLDLHAHSSLLFTHCSSAATTAAGRSERSEARSGGERRSISTLTPHSSSLTARLRQRPQWSESPNQERAHLPIPSHAGGLGVGDAPKAFHQRVNHDKSGYNPRSVHRFLLAAIVGLTTAIVPEMSVDVNEQSR